MSPTLEDVVIEGKHGLVAYLDADFNLTDAKAAVLAKVTFDDGRSVFYTVTPTAPDDVVSMASLTPEDRSEIAKRAWDTRGRGQSEHQVGITSAAPDRPSREVFRDMAHFNDALRRVPGVSDVSVQPGVGQTRAWGHEPTWVVSYRGNGAAKELVTETGRAYHQHAVLFLSGGCHQDCSPVAEFTFAHPMPAARRAAVDKAMGALGFDGWTWGKSGGKAFIRAVHVPQWSKRTPVEFLNATHEAHSRLRAAGVDVSVRRHKATVEVLDLTEDRK